MKILIVCSVNFGRIMPFVSEQGDELVKLGHVVEYFPISSKGLKGYLKHLPKLRKKLKSEHFDLVHAHYGLCGALSVMQRMVPVVVTFHNGETLHPRANLISSVGSLFSAYNIYVAQHIYDLTYFKRRSRSMILPCGINTSDFKLIDQPEARQMMELHEDRVNVLFGGVFWNPRKNVALAREAIALLHREDINLIELRGYTRQEVSVLLNAVDLMLLTTKSEGSPQIVKEAMACNCPVVSTDVADIAKIVDHTEGCYLTGYDPQDIADKITRAIDFGKRTRGRERAVACYDNKIIIQQLVEVYEKVMNRV